MSSTESRVSTKKAGIPMRTETEMFDVILQTAKVLQVDAVAMSGSRTDTKAPKDEFQDYDVVYVVDDLDTLTSNLAWLDQFGKRIIEQEVTLGTNRLYLMLFEDCNRIDLTLCPQEHMQEWVDSEAGFTVLEDKKGLFEIYSPSQSVFGYIQLVRRILKNLAMNFGGCQPTWSKEFVVSNLSIQLIISTVFVSKNC